MSEEELAAFFDEHKGDLSIWESTPVSALTPPSDASSIVISVRFNRNEIRRIQRAARKRGMTVGRWIKKLALEDFDEMGWIHVSGQDAVLLRHEP